MQDLIQEVFTFSSKTTPPICGYQSQKLVCNDYSAFYNFGSNVILSDFQDSSSSLLLAATNHSSNKGAGYIFTQLSPNVWNQTAKIYTTDTFGGSNSLFGVRFPFNLPTLSLVLPCLIPVFIPPNKTLALFTFTHKCRPLLGLFNNVCIPFDSSPNDRFGSSVSTFDQTLVFGSLYADSASRGDCGAVYVFNRTGTSLDATTKKLVSTDSVSGDQFGYSVDVYQTTIANGSLWNDAFGKINVGTVYFFTQSSNGTWFQTQRLNASDGSSNDRFGFSLALEETTLVVRAPFANRINILLQGAVYIFVVGFNSSILQQKLSPSDSSYVDLFGWCQSHFLPTPLL